MYQVKNNNDNKQGDNGSSLRLVLLFESHPVKGWTPLLLCENVVCDISDTGVKHKLDKQHSQTTSVHNLILNFTVVPGVYRARSRWPHARRAQRSQLRRALWQLCDGWCQNQISSHRAYYSSSMLVKGCHDAALGTLHLSHKHTMRWVSELALGQFVVFEIELKTSV